MTTHFAAIARHGDYQQPEGVPSAYLPYPLTEMGRTQARQLADELLELATSQGASLHPVIDASTLLRAWETASIAAARLRELTGMRFDVEQFDALCERSVGAMANLTVEQIEGILALDPRTEVPAPGWKSDRNYKLPFPGTESLREAGVRVADHLRARMRVLAEREGAPRMKLFVGHGASIRNAAVELGMLDAEQLPRLSMHHARAIVCAFEGCKGFRHVAGAWKLRERGAAHD